MKETMDKRVRFVKNIIEFLKRKKFFSWFAVCFVITFVSLLFALNLPALLKWVNSWEWLQGTDYFWVTDEIADWFAFYGGFIGVIVSVILTVVTIHLTVKIDRSNQKSINAQNDTSLIMNMPELRCKSIELRSLNRGDFSADHISRFPESQNYYMALRLEYPFPVCYRIGVSGIELYAENRGNKVEGKVELDEQHYDVTNAEKFEVHLNLPSELDDVLDKIYKMDLMDTLGSKKEEQVIKIDIKFCLENALAVEKYDLFYFLMKFQLKNVGKLPV